MQYPSYDQVLSVKNWTELYILLQINPRNNRKTRKIQEFVRNTFPECKLVIQKYKGKVNDDEFARVIASCISIKQVIETIGWKLCGGSYDMVHKRIKKNNIDTSHFLGQAHALGKKLPFKKPLENYLTENNYTVSSHHLKMRLIQEGYKQHSCEICGISRWMGKPTPIQLDHINGDHSDNRIENLRILCPNCHAQTPTYGVRNRKRAETPPCSICNSPVKNKKRVTCGKPVCVSEHISKSKRKT